MTLTVSTSLGEYRATIGPHGRVVVPAPVRKALNWAEGTVLTFAVQDGQIVVFDQLTALRRFQEYAQGLITPGADVLHDFLVDRQAEARKEENAATQ